jgi:hypothetical protein
MFNSDSVRSPLAVNCAVTTFPSKLALTASQLIFFRTSTPRTGKDRAPKKTVGGTRPKSSAPGKQAHSPWESSAVCCVCNLRMRPEISSLNEKPSSQSLHTPETFTNTSVPLLDLERSVGASVGDGSVVAFVVVLASTSVVLFSESFSLSEPSWLCCSTRTLVVPSGEMSLPL